MHGVAAFGGHSYPLQVREPAPPVFVVGMTYIVAGHRAFATDFTFFCHGKTPYYLKTNIIVYTKTGYIHVPEKEGKLFLKFRHGLVLTLLYDYVTKVCLYFTVFSPVLSRGGFFTYPSVSEIYEKRKK
jgi:hypothetical protein